MGFLLIVLSITGIFLVFLTEFGRLNRLRKQSLQVWQSRDASFKELLKTVPDFIAGVRYYLPGKNELLNHISTIISRSQVLKFSEKRISLDKELNENLEILFSELKDLKELKKVSTFRDSYNRLEDSRAKLDKTRSNYNEIALMYNRMISRFPGFVVARLLKMQHLPVG